MAPLMPKADPQAGPSVAPKAGLKPGPEADPTAPSAFVITDARLVLRDQVVACGWVAVCDGRIVEIGEGQPPERGHSIGNDYLMPGFVELHTDHLETHIEPRPKVRFNVLASVMAYDVQIAGSGITTVFDCIRVGTDGDTPDPDMQPLFSVADALKQGGEAGILRAEHHTHLRCEVASENVLAAAEAMVSRYPVGIVSIMDHTPGQRQFRDKEKLATYYRGKLNMGEDQLQAFFAQRLALYEKNAERQRRVLVDMARAKHIVLASHDDTTVAHVDESLRDGARIAEFPTTMEAAVASHDAGIAVVMGSPNIMLGGSHSGNVAAHELAEAGTLDILSSDYVPGSLLQAVFKLTDDLPGIDLAKATAMVTDTPARAVGLNDRGRLEVGRRADLLRVARIGPAAVAREVYRRGRRVA